MNYSQKILHNVAQFIEQHQLFKPNHSILCAVSGGIDSIVLLDILFKLKYKLQLAHCNFKLRGKAADKDEALVKKYADKLGLPFHTIAFDTAQYAKEKGVSIQMAARELRYNWFQKIRKENNLHSIATAHHINDNVETVLLNLTKGTGIKGMIGIQTKNNVIVRPLLCLNKHDIEKYAKKQHLLFRADASNSDNKYERNFLRNNVIPQLETINPQLLNTFSANSQHFQDAYQIFENGLKKLLTNITENRNGHYYISIKKLIQQPGWKTVLFHYLETFNFSPKQVEEAIAIIDAESGKQLTNEKFRLVKSRDFLIITPLPDEKYEKAFIIIKDAKQQITTQNFKLKFQIKKYKGVQNKDIAWYAQLDAQKVLFPLTLRLWKKGDYFYPLGMEKKKKISDFLVNEKISLPEKEQTYVLLSDEKVICILGKRIDNRFKTNDNTKKVLEIKIK